MNIVKRNQPEPEVHVGNCCGCNTYPITLYKIPGIYRYRCAGCFQTETGYSHHLAPSVTRIVLP